MNRVVAFANNTVMPKLLGIESSTFVTGTVKLLNDGAKAMLIIAPLVATACWIYMGTRRMNAEEQESIMWKKRMVGVGLGLVVAIGASVITAIVTHYYS